MENVTLFYNSGTKVHVKVDDLTVSTSRETGEIVRMEWKTMSPRPLHLGARNIAAVFMGHI